MKFSTLTLTLAVATLLSIIILGIISLTVNASFSFVKHEKIERNQNTTAVVNQINKTDF